MYMINHRDHSSLLFAYLLVASHATKYPQRYCDISRFQVDVVELGATLSTYQTTFLPFCDPKYTTSLRYSQSYNEATIPSACHGMAQRHLRLNQSEKT